MTDTNTDETAPFFDPLAALETEAAHRREATPGVSLSEESVNRLAHVAHDAVPSEVAFADKSVEQQADIAEGVLDVLTDPQGVDPDDPFNIAVLAIAPLLMELEAERAKTAPVPADDARPTLAGVADVDHGDSPAEKIIATFATLAFCSEGGTSEFTIPVEPHDFTDDAMRIRYKPEVLLCPKKRRVTINEVVALDEAGQPAARMKMVAPLMGGGGRTAKFKPGTIAFWL